MMEITLGLAVFVTGHTAFADGESHAAIVATERSTPTTRQYDKRLPPVMPGEEIVTETGQKMRVWSSSGPVPVNAQPTPQSLPSSSANSGIGLLVDGRK